MDTNTTVALKSKLMSSCCYGVYFFEHSFSSITIEIKNFIINVPKDSLFIVLVLNAGFITVYLVKAVQDDISSKTVPI